MEKMEKMRKTKKSINENKNNKSKLELKIENLRRHILSSGIR